MVSSSAETSSQPHRIAATLLWTSGKAFRSLPGAQRSAGGLEAQAPTPDLLQATSGS
jgi:hypothetical protein